MSWSRRLEKIILTVFCLQVGIVLLVFPWTSVWDNNYFFDMSDSLRPIFLSSFFRGAVNGLGVLNLYLAVTEFVEFVGSFLEEPTRRV